MSPRRYLYFSGAAASKHHFGAITVSLTSSLTVKARCAISAIVKEFMRSVYKPEEVLRVLSITEERVLEHLVRSEKIRAWAINDRYGDYYPLQYHCWLTLIDGVDPNRVIDADWDFTRAEVIFDESNKEGHFDDEDARDSHQVEPTNVCLKNIRYEQAEVMAVIPQGFSFDRGFTSVTFKGTHWPDLARSRSAIIQQLWDSFLLDENGVQEDELYQHPTIADVRDKRVANTFKGHPLFGTLIQQVGQTKKFRLLFE